MSDQHQKQHPSLAHRAQGLVETEPGPYRGRNETGYERGLVGFLGALLVSGAFLLVFGVPPGNAWWLGADYLPQAFIEPAAALLGVLLLGFAMGRLRHPWQRWLLVGLLAGALLLLVIDTARVVWVAATGRVEVGLLPPLSFWLALAMGLLSYRVLRYGFAAPEGTNGEQPLAHGAASIGTEAGSVAPRGKGPSTWQGLLPWLKSALGFGFGGALFALAQMAFLGTTDYRRPVDAVVVFGARVYRDGTPSLALLDRVRTAARLVHDGWAPILVVSGGPGDGTYHETDVMRRLALDEGVTPGAIQVDRGGLSTRATARRTVEGWASRNSSRPRPRILAVSHGYHLPRARLALLRAGATVYTVPAKESRTLLMLPYYVAREVLGYWAYYFCVLDP